MPPEGLGIEVREGQLDPRSEGERHAVTWLTLADAGIALRGQAPNGRWIAADRNAAIHHSRGNLQTYWRKWLETRRRLISPGGLNLLADEAVVWGCLGVARLHATIAQGRVRSKTGAGQHALEAFPDHARVVRESLRLRTEPGAPPVYRSPLVRRRDLIAFMEAVIGSGV